MLNIIAINFLVANYKYFYPCADDISLNMCGCLTYNILEKANIKEVKDMSFKFRQV